MVSLGGGRHVYYLTGEQLVGVQKWSYLSEPPILLLYSVAKTSVALLILRFVDRATRWRKLLLYFLIGSIFFANILTIILTFSSCTPARALWVSGIEGASCRSPAVLQRYAYFGRGWNILVDAVLALLPISFISSLQLTKRKRFALCILLGLGFLYVEAFLPHFVS